MLWQWILVWFVRRDLKFWPFLQGVLFFFIFEFRVLTFVFRLRKFTFSRGLLWGVPRVCPFLDCWEVLQLVSKWPFKEEFVAGLPRVFDILVLFGIKVVNFLCSGREGFQLYTRVCLASSSGLWLFRGMSSKCQVWRLLHMEQGAVRGEWCSWLWVFCF